MNGPDAALREQARAAAATIGDRYGPGAAQMLARELRDWSRFGYRFGGHQIVAAMTERALRTHWIGQAS